jgi:CBS domain containing-hemolysin-like protein
MFELILAVAAALGVSSFCTLCEAVLYSLRLSRIERLRAEGSRAGETFYKLRTGIEKPATAILAVNTTACAAGSALAGAYAARYFGEDAVPAFAAALALAILVFGELLPRTFGSAFAPALAPALAGPLRVMAAALSPLAAAGAALRGIVTPKDRAEGASEDDIRAMVRLTSRAGRINPLEERSIYNILALDTKHVRDIMTPRTVVFSLPASMSVAEAKAANPLWSHSRVPVFGDGDPENIVGVALRRDVFEALANDQDAVTLAGVMKPVQFVPDSMPLDKALVQFIESRLHLFVVLDEYGGVAGVVSLEDVLEEILGKEIIDETDEVADMRSLAKLKREKLLRGQGR